MPFYSLFWVGFGRSRTHSLYSQSDHAVFLAGYGARARQAAGRLGARLFWRGPRIETNIPVQRRLLNICTQESSVDAIVLTPSDFGSLNPEIEQAAKKGIKIVIMDSPSSSEYVESYIATEIIRPGTG